MKSNIGLVNHCEKALKEKWFYCWGSYGQIPTVSIIKKLITQYPSNKKWEDYLLKSINKTRISDCYGLVKSYLWWTGDKENPKYNKNQDRNTKMAFEFAKEKGNIKDLPENVLGTILYMKGHVGIVRPDRILLEIV